MLCIYTKVLEKLSQVYTLPTGLQKGIKGCHLSRNEKNAQVKTKTKKLDQRKSLLWTIKQGRGCGYR